MFIVYASDYDAMEVFGIFDTKEKAEFCLSEVVKEEGEFGFFKPDQFKIKEIVVNAIYYDGFFYIVYLPQNEEDKNG